MKKYLLRSLVFGAIIILGTSACLRSASDADFVAPQSRDLATPLPPPTPTWTPEPAEEIEEPEFELPLNGEDAEVVDGEDEISLELENDDGEEPESGFPGLMLPQTGVTEEPPVVAQQATLDPLFIEATNIVATRTQEVIDLTATAEGPVIDFPTATPTFDQFVPTATPGSGIGGTCVHTVSAGENLFRISLRYNVTVADIATANGISNVNLISVGQQLNIPGCGSGTTPPGGGTGGPITGGTRHTVQQGETLFQISMRYNVPVMTIASANGISNINLIYLGQELVIP